MGSTGKTAKILMGGSHKPQRCTFLCLKVTILSGINRNEFFFKQMVKYDNGGCCALHLGGGMWGDASRGQSVWG